MTLKLQPGEMINSKLCCQQIASLQQAILTNRLIEKVWGFFKTMPDHICTHIFDEQKKIDWVSLEATAT